MTPAELRALSAFGLLTALRARQVSVTEVVTATLDGIEASPDAAGWFADVDRDGAIERATVVERDVPRASALWGMPVAEKDLVARAGRPAGAGSLAMRGRVAEVSDEAVIVADRAGAVSVGRTTSPEFGLHCYTANAVQPPAASAYDPALNAGGSSGGAAGAVAAGLLPFAAGSDGGGSIRIPAAVNGLVGLKTSRGLVPGGDGVGALGGLGVHGPLARSVEDAALLLEGMLDRRSGVVPHATALRAPEPADLLSAAVRGEGRFVIGTTTTTPWDEWCEIAIDRTALDVFGRAATELAAIGHEVDELAWRPDPAYAEDFRVIWRSGAASIPLDAGQEELLEPITRGIRERGRELGAADLARALQGLHRFERETIRAFSGVDAVLTPALAMPPRPHDWYDREDVERNFRQQVQYTPFTSFVNVAGLPAIVLPVEAPGGAPVGVQLIGRPGGEATLLAIGQQLQRRYRWQFRRPPAR